jgi:hypothetical protein
MAENTGNFPVALAYAADPKLTAFVTQNWKDFLDTYVAYLDKQGNTKYATASFRWFRPPDAKDEITPSNIAVPFQTDEIDGLLTSIIQIGRASCRERV